MRITTIATLSFTFFILHSPWSAIGGQVEIEEVLARRSPVPQPYAYVSGGRIVGEGVRTSPDPLVAYKWDAPKADDQLQVFVMRPVLVTDKSKCGNFLNLSSACGEHCAIEVKGPGTILLDFGSDLPAWLEVDSPDLAGTVTMGVSEYNERYSAGKVGKPKKIGECTYRYEPNKELYEGLRFGFINVEKLVRPFTITAIRAVTQVKPTNYTGSFSCDNEMLERVWYTAAWDVRANFRMDCFGAILMDRGDRISWTGDAYPTQHASLAAFSNYDAVLKNLRFTECHRNGIESYELYWVESLIDYYMYSGDAEGVRSLLPQAFGRLDHAAKIFDNPSKLHFIGWDERTGIGFDHPDCEQNKYTYQLLAIGAWKHFADVLDALPGGTRSCASASLPVTPGGTRSCASASLPAPSGADAQERVPPNAAARYRQLAAEKTAKLLADPQYFSRLGMHASADAINAGLLPDLSRLYHKGLSDRLQRCSFSPFNQCFLIDAMAAAGRHADALAAIRDVFGGQIANGGTCFYEVFRPNWNDILAPNDPVPFTQSGHTSLAHPWGAGVLSWLTEEMLGIKPITPGFATFVVQPHLCGFARRVSGSVDTPHGTIEASFNLMTGEHSLTVPNGTTATFAIPKEGMEIVSIREGRAPARPPTRTDSAFAYFDNLGPGHYAFKVTYRGRPAAAKEEKYHYAAQLLAIDQDTHGDWFKKYGTEGYYVVGGLPDKSDLAVLPDYVQSVTFDYVNNQPNHRTVLVKPCDERAAMATDREGKGEKAFGCWFSHGLQMCPVDIRLKQPREFTVALYIADCAEGGRDQCVDAFDLDTLELIAPSARVRDLRGGVYLVYRYNRSIRFRCYNIRGANAVINGVFFGEKG